VYGDGPAPEAPDARLVFDAGACGAIDRGESSLLDAVRQGRVEVVGEGALAKELREV
ncbi:transcriptional regulator, partial [Streptomyces ipomoeae]|nr:transcriptional regulator [Streptomyces ipomoeae]